MNILGQPDISMVINARREEADGMAIPEGASRVWKSVAVFSMVIAVLATVAPQISHYGRGLRTTLPALVVALIAINHIAPGAFVRSFVRFRPAFILGILFLAQSGLRIARDEDPGGMWRTFFVSPLLILVFLLWFGALAELGEDVVHSLRRWVLLSWCLSLAVGLPALLDNPGVARLTMSSDFGVENSAQWAPYGVAEYSTYTSFAIAVASLLCIARMSSSRTRYPSLLLVLLGCAAVVVSTFTMAAALLLLGVFCALLVWVFAAAPLARAWRSIIVVLFVTSLPFLYTQSILFPQTNFIVTKAERLYTGIAASGIESGDETSRGAWFTDEMQSFMNEPFLGYIPHVTGQRGHGHSSLSNSLVLFGIFGTLMWLVALWIVLRDCLRNAENVQDRYSLLISWVCLLLGGILNPIWHSTQPFVVLFALTLTTRKYSAESSLIPIVTPGFFGPQLEPRRMA